MLDIDDIPTQARLTDEEIVAIVVATIGKPAADSVEITKDIRLLVDAATIKAWKVCNDRVVQLNA